MTAYVIADVKILDLSQALQYFQLAQASILRHGGKIIVQGAEPEVPEGDWPAEQHVVVIEFPTMEQLKAWYTSADYAEALVIRKTALDRRLLFVEGVAD